MVKRYFFIWIFFSSYVAVFSQSPATTHYITEKVFNWGIRAGLNAVVPSYYTVTYNGESTINQTMINEVGYSGGLFGRVNLSSFFMQPEASYFYTPEKLSFTILQEDALGNYNMTIRTQTQSVSVAVLLGFNIVKEGPFLFNIFCGPAAYYNFLTTYEIDKLHLLRTEAADYKHITNYKLSMVTGISANISRLYFDFRLSIGMKSSMLDFSELQEAPEHLQGIAVKDNGNLLCFSCGIMF